MIFLYILGILVWIFGIFAIMGELCEETPNKQKLLNIIKLIISFGIFGFWLQFPAIYNPVFNIKTETIAPLSVIKTNNITFVTYKIGNRKIKAVELNTANYWNSTNIMVEYKVGKSIYGCKVYNNGNVIIKE